MIAWKLRTFWNSILFHLNMISESFVKGQKQSVIYKFIPNVVPGYKITKTKQGSVYLRRH